MSYPRDSISTAEARKRGFVSYNLAPEDKLYTCPYVTSHQVLEHRFSRHLVKCRENYKKLMAKTGKEMEMGICKWNFNHHVPTMEMTTHEMICSDSARVVDYLIGVQNSNTSSGSTGFSAPNLRGARSTAPHGQDPMEEDWEPDVQRNIQNGTGSYDPHVKLAMNKGLIIQSMPGISTPAERKIFREEQARAFEDRGGDFYDEARSAVTHRVVQAQIPIPVATVSSTPSEAPSSSASNSSFDVRQQRAMDIAQAQRNAALSAEHQKGANKNRKKSQAYDQISAILDMARSESLNAGSSSSAASIASTASSTSTATLEADTASVTSDDSGYPNCF